MIKRLVMLLPLMGLVTYFVAIPLAWAVAATDIFNNIPTGYTVPGSGQGTGNLINDLQYNEAQGIWGNNVFNFGSSIGGGGSSIGGGGSSIGGGSGTIDNPLAADSIPQFINQLLDVVIQIGVPVLVVMIVFVGYKFVAAQGNSTKLDEAKEAFKWTIIGAAIVLGAFVISSVIQVTVNNLGA